MRMTGVAMVFVLAAGGCAEEKAQTREPSRTAVDESATPQQQADNAAAVSPERHDAVERIFARKATELQNCWSEEYDKSHNRKLEGDVTVQLTVAPSGKADDVKIVKSSIASPAIETCVVKTVGNWAFPEGNGSMPYLRTVHLGAQF